MADIVSESYIAFARTGDPNNPHMHRTGPHLTPARRATMIFDSARAHRRRPTRGRERRYLGQVPYVQPGT